MARLAMTHLVARALERELLKTLVSFWVFGLSILVGCSTDQAGRMESYLGPGVSRTEFSAVDPLRVPSVALKAGLLVINHTTGQDSAPPLSILRDWGQWGSASPQQTELTPPLVNRSLF